MTMRAPRPGRALDRHAVILVVEDLESLAHVADADALACDFRPFGGLHAHAVVFHFEQ